MYKSQPSLKASPKAIDQQSVNLHYIRAAIEARTGRCLTFNQIRRYLVEEKLLTPTQARKFARVITSYSSFHDNATGYGHSKGSYDHVEEDFDIMLPSKYS